MYREDFIQQHLDNAWNLRGTGNYEESKKVLELALERCDEDDFPFLARIHHIYN